MGCASSAPSAVARRYRVDSKLELGSGGQGRVFAAQDRRKPGQRVAIKRSPASSEDSRWALQREATLMRSLDHPNICRLLDTFEQRGAVFFVMEMCSGGDLADRLQGSGRLPEAGAAGILRQVAGALQHAHRRGIAHRDVKPENICLQSSAAKTDHVKLIDWGCGCFFDKSRTMRSNVGSCVYMAPEVSERWGTASGYTQACDFWSLGVVAYIALSGVFPFWGTDREVLEAAKNERYCLEGCDWQDISKSAKDFIASLLKYVPEERMNIEAAVKHRWWNILEHATLSPPSVEEHVTEDFHEIVVSV